MKQTKKLVVKNLVGQDTEVTGLDFNAAMHKLFDCTIQNPYTPLHEAICDNSYQLDEADLATFDSIVKEQKEIKENKPMKEEQVQMEMPELNSQLMCAARKKQLIKALNKAAIESKYRLCITPDHLYNIISKVMFGHVCILVDNFEHIRYANKRHLTHDHFDYIKSVAKLLRETGCIRWTKNKAIQVTGKITGIASRI